MARREGTVRVGPGHQEHRHLAPIRAFCTRRALSEPSFYAWRRTLKERARRRPAARRQATLVPLHVIAAPVLEVLLPTGVVVRVPAGVEPTTVASLVAALRAMSC